MRNKVIFIFLFAHSILSAQQSFQLSVDSRNGYEHNVFNATTVPISSEGGKLQTPVVKSGTYQHLGVRMSWKRKTKSYSFSLNGKGSKDFFKKIKTANILKTSAGLSYRRYLGDHASLVGRITFLSQKTQRSQNAQDEFLFPSNFDKWKASISFSFKPLKRNTTQLELIGQHKTFMIGQNRLLSYISKGVGFQTKQRIAKSKKFKHYLSLEVSYHQRDYVDQIVPISENDVEVKDKKRLWRYQKAEAGYTLKYLKAIKVNTSVYLENRQDILDNRYSYFLWGPSLDLDWESNTFTARIKISRTYRKFNTLTADNNKLHPLRHKYMRISFDANYRINQHLLLTTQLRWVDRWRNLPENYSQGFMPYTNSLVDIGLRFQL